MTNPGRRALATALIACAATLLAGCEFSVDGSAPPERQAATMDSMWVGAFGSATGTEVMVEHFNGATQGSAAWAVGSADQAWRRGIID